MPRRNMITIVLPPDEPEPEYDLYQELRRDAENRARGFLGPDDLARMTEVATRRGADWCTAVLGRSFPGVTRISTVDGWTLIGADELNLDPPLPRRIAEEREADEQRRKANEILNTVELEMAKRRWNLLAGGSPVRLTVQENTRHTGPHGPTLHAVPDEDAVSGKTRRHLAHRALCETPGRADPLHLGGPVDLPPTCVRCLDYAAKIRAANTPAPPTDAEAALLRLIASGAVVTFHVRGGSTIRDTTTRSRAAWGHLGRKLDTAVKKLERKGWVKQDDAATRTQRAFSGHLWRLTDAGLAALED
ncbi:hypothetical protein ACPCAG_30875 [Streptomyces pseudogriseolus]|uniref:hypothetical protein n=1 Tax=Streptomyces pseudogriseolus TaxID=36817 RepID=UPI003FA27F02